MLTLFYSSSPHLSSTNRTCSLKFSFSNIFISSAVLIFGYHIIKAKNGWNYQDGEWFNVFFSLKCFVFHSIIKSIRRDGKTLVHQNKLLVKDSSTLMWGKRESCSEAVLPNLVAARHTWLLSTWNVACLNCYRVSLKIRFNREKKL